MKLVIKNGKVYYRTKFIEASVVVENGVIVDITKRDVDADEKIDAKGDIVLPGSIDPHVHFREPGFEYKEDFLTGSRAAASGGVTTVIDMPNTKPPVLTNRILKMKTTLAKKSIIDYGFHFGSSEDNAEEIRRSRNIASVKVYMNSTTGNLLVRNMDVVREILNMRFSSFHAEGKTVEDVLKLAKSLKKKVYLCHISSESEIEIIKRFREHAFVEVTPHHLFLTGKDQNKLIKMKPSLKTDKDRKALWNAINENIVDTVGSDHAPHTIEEKMERDIYGVPGVETRVPLMLDAVNRGFITMDKFVELLCENPAKIFRIKNKGFIEKGYDADLMIVDMKVEKRITSDMLYTKCGWSPFEGKTLKGWPVKTILRGVLVYDGGEVYDGHGKEITYCEEGS